MTDRVSTAGRCSAWLVLGLLVGITGQGCSPAQAPVSRADRGIAGAQAEELPPGAVKVGEDLYQVPIGADEDGCTMYRLHSETLLVAQVISYRDVAGGFTTDRREADCPGSASH